jgi:hypothetical protein
MIVVEVSGKKINGDDIFISSSLGNTNAYSFVLNKWKASDSEFEEWLNKNNIDTSFFSDVSIKGYDKLNFEFIDNVDKALMKDGENFGAGVNFKVSGNKIGKEGINRERKLFKMSFNLKNLNKNEKILTIKQIQKSLQKRTVFSSTSVDKEGFVEISFNRYGFIEQDKVPSFKASNDSNLTFSASVKNMGQNNFISLGIEQDVIEVLKESGIDVCYKLKYDDRRYAYYNYNKVCCVDKNEHIISLDDDMEKIKQASLVVSKDEKQVNEEVKVVVQTTVLDIQNSNNIVMNALNANKKEDKDDKEAILDKVVEKQVEEINVGLEKQVNEVSYRSKGHDGSKSGDAILKAEQKLKDKEIRKDKEDKKLHEKEVVVDANGEVIGVDTKKKRVNHLQIAEALLKQQLNDIQTKQVGLIKDIKRKIGQGQKLSDIEEGGDISSFVFDACLNTALYDAYLYDSVVSDLNVANEAINVHEIELKQKDVKIVENEKLLLDEKEKSKERLNEIRSLEGKYTSYKSGAEKKVNDLSTNISELNNDKDELKKAVVTAIETIDKYSVDFTKIKEDLDNANSAIDKITEEKDEAVKASSEVIDDLNKKLESSKNDVSDANSKVEMIKARAEANLANKESVIDSQKAIITSKETSLNAKDERINEQSSINDKQKNVIDEQKNVIDEQLLQINKLQEAIASMEERLVSLKKQEIIIDNKKEIATKEERLFELSKQVDEKSDVLNSKDNNSSGIENFMDKALDELDKGIEKLDSSSDIEEGGDNEQTPLFKNVNKHSKKR